MNFSQLEVSSVSRRIRENSTLCRGIIEQRTFELPYDFGESEELNADVSGVDTMIQILDPLSEIPETMVRNNYKILIMTSNPFNFVYTLDLKQGISELTSKLRNVRDYRVDYAKLMKGGLLMVSTKLRDSLLQNSSQELVSENLKNSLLHFHKEHTPKKADFEQYPIVTRFYPLKIT